MGKTLYLECYSGISGDMTVAALLDLGADEKVLKTALESLPVKGFEIEISRVKKAGLDACDFLVKLDRNHENHDHDMEYLHGHSHMHHHEEECMEEEPHTHKNEHAYEDEHVHENEHVHEIEHVHEHSHVDGHIHEHRGLPEVLHIIENAQISARARKTAIDIFKILAFAEAKAHGVPIEQVHFHEVGAVDSIVDIVAAAVCLDNLDITEVVVPFVCEGRGTVRCQHGILPVPVPAVINIMEEFKLPVRITEVEGELVTPTGAAILAAVKTASRLPEQFIITHTGIGAGKRKYERPSLLRAMLIEEKGENHIEKSSRQDEIYKLETNIDDCTGELLGYTMDRLMGAGARDVHFTPVYMKKNRPAYMLTVICDEAYVKKLEQIIFEETTTIGIRRMQMERTILEREENVIALEKGEVKAKRCILPDGQVRLYPEYESVAELARKNGVSFQQVMEEVKRMS